VTSSYLVCERCGNHGPPAGFFFKDGIRLCYACYFDDPDLEHEPEDPNAKDCDEARNRRRGDTKP
jgi:hypothetical protein